jgi:ribonucleotide reductase alpha subunit
MVFQGNGYPSITQEMVTRVQKRDGSFEIFNIEKIEVAIQKAFKCTSTDADLLTVKQIITPRLHSTSNCIHIEEIQNIIENILMELGYYQTAKAYIIYRKNKNDQRNVKSYLQKISKETDTTPWGPLGYITYKRTYSRRENDGVMEEHNDTIIRVLTAAQEQLHVGFSNDELKRAFIYLKNLKFSVAGRFLWQLGTETVNKHGLASLQNCAFVMVDSHVQPFTWIFDMLMLGVGVGFNIQKSTVAKIMPVHFYANKLSILRKDTKDADFIVPDSREGWVQLLQQVLIALFETGKSFTYSTILVRSAGALIKGFGGVASGPDDLCNGITTIVNIIQNRSGDHLSTVDCLDIVNIIASIVVAGNIRRSACIAIGDCHDIDYLGAKRWDLGNIPNWRAFSNNSVICNDINDLPDEFWEGYKGNGEPYGLINIDLSRKSGRLKDGELYPDPDVQGYNPCLVGETLIAVADGRGAVPIKQLADEGKDVPVYSVNEEGTVEIKWGRHPRITGHNQNIVKVVLDDGTSIKTTLNHKFRLTDGTMIEAKDLQPKMSLTRFTNYDKWCQENINPTNLPTKFIDGKLYAIKICENCNCGFYVPFIKREVGYCSIMCCNTATKAIEKKHILHDQIMVYKDLQDALDRDPIHYEWENECRIRNIHVSDNDSYKDLQNRADVYNHRVKYIEFLAESSTVYNITVDDNHTVGIITSFDNFAGDGIFVAQCGEQSLCNYETCCLSEVFLPNVQSYGEFKDITAIAYRICKHSLMLPCHHDGTQDIVQKNMRMGIGITGYLQATDEQRAWLAPLYEWLREYDVYYSSQHKMPRSIKLTTVKPSGTLSLLAGVTPGAHPGIYPFFIRRIRIATDNELVDLCKANGYHVEYQLKFDGTFDYKTSVVSFPCKYPAHTVFAENMTAIEQLNIIKKLQYDWSDNAVSVTIYYKKDELDAIKDWLSNNYQHNVKSCSFLLHSDHGFKQAPYEQISENEYNEMIAKVKPIVYGDISLETDYTLECASGSCPIR